jgi:hypothetical protein
MGRGKSAQEQVWGPVGKGGAEDPILRMVAEGEDERLSSSGITPPACTALLSKYSALGSSSERTVDDRRSKNPGNERVQILYPLRGRCRQGRHQGTHQ